MVGAFPRRIFEASEPNVQMKLKTQSAVRQSYLSPRLVTMMAVVTSIVAAPFQTSPGCGGPEWGWFEPDPGENMTAQLVVDHGWARVPVRDPDDPNSTGYAYTDSKGKTMSAKAVTRSSAGSYLEPNSSKSRSVSRRLSQESDQDWARVRSLQISGPVGTEVTVERSKNGLDWEFVDFIFLEDDKTIRWNAAPCVDGCDTFEYRCTGYSWHFEEDAMTDHWGGRGGW